jgi:hypothetical protein
MGLPFVGLYAQKTYPVFKNTPRKQFNAEKGCPVVIV